MLIGAELPVDVVEAAKEAANDLLPTKSRLVYEQNYTRFIKWCTEKKIGNDCSEPVVLAYFKHFSSTLWSHFSMIKSLLNLRKGVDISKYTTLRMFLKKKNENYLPKKARVLTKEDFDRFIFEAPDEKYLGNKAVLIFGIAGGCRCDELWKMKIDDVEDLGSLILVKVPTSKNHKRRSFHIIGEQYINIYRKYASLRPQDMNDRRLFIKYQNGRCCRMVMGIHKIGGVTREVASFLKIPDYKDYTGHCMRRTGATLLVDAGGGEATLKRFGGWSSSKVAQGYIDESKRIRDEIAFKILLSNVPEKDLGQSSDTGIEKVKNETAAEKESSHLPVTLTAFSESSCCAPVPDETVTIPVSLDSSVPVFPRGSISAEFQSYNNLASTVNSALASTGTNFQNATLTNCTFTFQLHNAK